MCTQGILFANAALSTLLNAYYRNTLLRHGLPFYALTHGSVEQNELESYSFFVHSTHTMPTGYHSLVHFNVYYSKTLVEYSTVSTHITATRWCVVYYHFMF